MCHPEVQSSIPMSFRCHRGPILKEASQPFVHLISHHISEANPNATPTVSRRETRTAYLQGSMKVCLWHKLQTELCSPWGLGRVKRHGSMGHAVALSLFPVCCVAKRGSACAGKEKHAAGRRNSSSCLTSQQIHHWHMPPLWLKRVLSAFKIKKVVKSCLLMKYALIHKNHQSVDSFLSGPEGTFRLSSLMFCTTHTQRFLNWILQSDESQL